MAVTVAAQVASVSARRSTPVRLFLPVAGSQPPQAWKSYLHSPARRETQSHAFAWRRRRGRPASNHADNLLKPHKDASIFVRRPAAGASPPSGALMTSAFHFLGYYHPGKPDAPLSGERQRS